MGPLGPLMNRQIRSSLVELGVMAAITSSGALLIGPAPRSLGPHF
jgi:hypothetical protein